METFNRLGCCPFEMVSKNERTRDSEGVDRRLLGGIYRVVKSIEEKVESFLEELSEFAEAKSEDYYLNGSWDEHANGFL